MYNINLTAILWLPQARQARQFEKKNCPQKVENPPSKVAQKNSNPICFSLLPWFPKRPKQKNSCSKMWLIDQLYIELGIWPFFCFGGQNWRPDTEILWIQLNALTFIHFLLKEHQMELKKLQLILLLRATVVYIFVNSQDLERSIIWSSKKSN